MPSPEEIRFAQQRRLIWKCIVAECRKVDAAFETFPIKLMGNLDSLVGSLQGHTLSGQQQILKRTYRHLDGRELSFELSIGHTGENWEPVVTVLDEQDYAYSLLMGESPEMDLSELRATIYRRIAACSGK